MAENQTQTTKMAYESPAVVYETMIEVFAYNPPFDFDQLIGQ
jgi:hypothetical protein